MLQTKIDNPYETLELFITDFHESQHSPDVTVEDKSQLLNTIGRFGLQHGLPIDYIAHRLEMPTDSLLQELEVDEALSKAFHKTTTEGLNMGGSPEKTDTSVYTTDPEALGWLNGKPAVKLPAVLVETEDLTYRLVDLVGLHRVPKKLRQKLLDQHEYESLHEKLTHEAIPKLYKDVKTLDGKLRPVAMGNRTKKEAEAVASFKCKLPAYKVDAHGTNNRAIIVFLGNSSDKEPVPQFGLAALYDHDDDEAIHSALFAKQK